MITQNDLIAMQLQADSKNTPEYILKKLIEQHDTSEMERGVRYYHNESDIKSREAYYYDADGRKIIDHGAVNNRVPHNWHKLLVDQKVAYLLGRPVVINADPDAYADLLNEWLDEEFDDKLQEIGKNASNKGAEYLHPYINEEGQFRFAIIPREQVIPIYDTEFQEEIVELIRFYTVWVNDRERIKAEWWDSEKVTYYIQGNSDNFELEITEGQPNPDSHFYYNEKGYGWLKVPFIEFRNNEEKFPDLKYYQEVIDVYDLVVSDLANDLESLQKMIYVLKGYEGTSMKEFVDNLRYFRSVKVSGEDGAGVDLLQADIPVTAIDSFLDRSEENIFLFGQGVNVKTDKFGAAPSGIALKFLYTLLDLKANIMARKFAFAIKDFCWFLSEYLSIAGVYAVPEDAVDTIRITFTKSMLVNDLELVSMAQASKGIISDETIVEYHPWVEDAQREKDLLALERESRIDLDKIDEEEEEEEEEEE